MIQSAKEREFLSASGRLEQCLEHDNARLCNVAMRENHNMMHWTKQPVVAAWVEARKQVFPLRKDPCMKNFHMDIFVIDNKLYEQALCSTSTKRMQAHVYKAMLKTEEYDAGVVVVKRI